jgi:outer membrane lipoprotein SlyB
MSQKGRSQDFDADELDPDRPVEGSVIKSRAAGAVTGAAVGAAIAGAVTGGLAAPAGAVAGGLLGQAVGGIAGAEATASGEAGDVEVVPAPGDDVATAADDAALPKVEEKKQ